MDTQPQQGLWHEKKEVALLARVFNPVLRSSRIFVRVPPNLVTLGCALLVPFMCIAFALDAIVMGAVLYALISIGDGFDGAIARYQERLHRREHLNLRRDRHVLMQRGETPFGTAFDPLIDKFCYAGALLPLGWHFLSPPACVAALLLAAALTLLRPYAKRRWSLDLPSNLWGKVKVQFERATIACLVFLSLHPALGRAGAITFSAATLLAAVSLCGQGLSLRRALKNRNP